MNDVTGQITAHLMDAAKLTVPSRRSRWLRTWLPAMGAFSAVAIAAMTWVAVLGFPGWQWVDVTIGAFAVITVGLNMWMAWESVQ